MLPTASTYWCRSKKSGKELRGVCRGNTHCLVERTGDLGADQSTLGFLDRFRIVIFYPANWEEESLALLTAFSTLSSKFK